ncbi:MAG: hypothetical protein GW911_18370 [Armatimonadetes bacterium]|nr:hypothetical protein [Armatimonadota bacterium]NCP33199.1 hypothetical protein [Armatimonadota bacterium]NDK13996.1 hypothetical protein [Armatimonadota bacterium]
MMTSCVWCRVLGHRAFSMRSGAAVVATVGLWVRAMAAPLGAPGSQSAGLLPTTLVFGPLDLSEIPPVLHLDWLKPDQYLLTCRGDPKEYGGNARLLFYCVDVRAKTLSLIGRQQPYHQWASPQPWRLVDAGEALFIFPALPPVQFDPLAPVYRSNPRGWSVQPYRSVSRTVLTSVLFSMLVEHGDRQLLRIIDGAGTMVAEAVLENGPLSGRNLQDCGIVQVGEAFSGVMGEPGAGGGYSRLWRYELPVVPPSHIARIALNAIGGDSANLRTDQVSPSADGAPEWFNPALACRDEGITLAWRRTTDASSDPTRETWECVADLGGVEKVLARYALQVATDPPSLRMAHEGDLFGGVRSRIGRTMEPSHPLRTPLLACSLDGGTIAYSVGWDLLVMAPDDWTSVEREEHALASP